MRSMTAFAEEVVELGEGEVQLLFHSVNRKGLDMHLQLPRVFLSFDPEFRKWIADEVKRGRVTLTMEWKRKGGTLPKHFLEALKSEKERWSAVAKEIGSAEGESASLEFLLRMCPFQDVPQMEEEERAKLQKGFLSGIRKLIEMKKAEGQFLCDELLLRLKDLEKFADAIEKQIEGKVDAYREKLLKRIEAVLEKDCDDERILKEVALFADKIDVSEELTRLRSHFEQFKTYLVSDAPSIGRTLEFFLQEIAREFNTIASKALDAKTSQLVVAAKGECEKMREQVQNVE